MGCNVSVLEDTLIKDGLKKQSKNSITTTVKVYGEEHGHFDARLPLTVRQKFNITKSWKGIARNIETTGSLMFLRLFETNLEIREMFSKFAQNGKYDITQFHESKELENHVRQVMYTLDEAISSLEDVDVVINLLHSVGRSHQRLQILGFNPQIFWKIEEPFLVAVKDTLGDRYTANMEHIYRKTIKFILETLIQGFSLQ